ncbi:hypothetical protein [Acidovorax sp. SDU_ACID1]|uniref:hypothetical protein n=1 Tax=Acidovorax sp. SDU_ACID1 TaxID=3136632 RepID=UPI003873B341
MPSEVIDLEIVLPDVLQLRLVQPPSQLPADMAAVIVGPPGPPSPPGAFEWNSTNW